MGVPEEILSPALCPSVAASGTLAALVSDRISALPTPLAGKSQMLAKSRAACTPKHATGPFTGPGGLNFSRAEAIGIRGHYFTK